MIVGDHVVFAGPISTREDEKHGPLPHFQQSGCVVQVSRNSKSHGASCELAVQLSMDLLAHGLRHLCMLSLWLASHQCLCVCHNVPDPFGSLGR